MKIGIINGDDGLKLKIKAENVHIKLIHEDTPEKFDIIIFNKRMNFIPEKLLALEDKKKYVLVNMDEYKSFCAFANTFLITYGMNNKSCVTLSSIQQNKIQIYIQRNLAALNGKIIEEQEFGIEIKNGEKILDELMFFAAANVLFYADINNLSKWF